MKLYYTIGEVAEMLGVKTSALRHWEKEFPQLKPQKLRGGERRYINSDIELLNEIKTLLKDQGYTIEGSRKVLSQKENNGKTSTTLLSLESELLKLRTELQNLKDKL